MIRDEDDLMSDLVVPVPEKQDSIWEKDFEKKNRKAFSKWWVATKKHSTSPLGSVETTLIISLFIGFGCFLGSFWTKVLGGPGYVAFILFAFGALQLYNCILLFKQRKVVKQQIETMKMMEEV